MFVFKNFEGSCLGEFVILQMLSPSDSPTPITQVKSIQKARILRIQKAKSDFSST